MNDAKVDNFLAHYGVKGMKWGVRNDRRAGSQTPNKSISEKLRARLDSDKTQPTTAKAKANVNANKKLHAKKFEASEAENPKGWRPTKKQLALIAAGAIVAGVIIYKVKTGNDVSGIFSKEDYLSAAQDLPSPDWLKEFAGKPMSSADYRGLVENSAGRLWQDGNFVTAKTFDRKEFSLSPGHQFYRLSARAEETFASTTYTLPSKEDLSRYVSSWKDPHGLRPARQVISFKAVSDVRVPDMTTQLNTLREVMSREGKSVSPAEVIAQYNERGGLGWSDPTSVSFLSALKGKGYSAIVDVMDEGVYGETPLVLFNSDVVSSKTAAPLTQTLVDSLTSTLTDIPNRR